MVRLNLNSVIGFRLNDYGKDIYYHRYDELNERLKAIGCKSSQYLGRRFPEVDKDGYSYFQLWEFMDIYGKHIGVGKPEFWKDLNFYIKDEDLEEVKERK